MDQRRRIHDAYDEILDADRGDSLVTGDMTRLPFADNAFDALTSFYAIIHVPTEEHSMVLGEFARVCRPGRVLFTASSEEWSGANDDWLDTGVSDGVVVSRHRNDAYDTG